MSIVNEITRLQNAKAALKTSLEAKGVTVASDATLDQYPALVDSIPSGENKTMSWDDDVVFMDYDGTILYTYTKQEFLALTSLPELPQHEGLIQPQWNWTLAEATPVVSTLGRLYIGATYLIEEDAIVYEISVKKIGYSNGNFRIAYSGGGAGDGGITIYWGDGTNTLCTNTGNGNYISHTYSAIGDYKVKIVSNTQKCTRSVNLYDASSKYIRVNKCVYNCEKLQAHNVEGEAFSDWRVKEVWFGRHNNSTFSISSSNNRAFPTKILFSRQLMGSTDISIYLNQGSPYSGRNLVIPKLSYTSLTINCAGVVSLPPSVGQSCSIFTLYYGVYLGNLPEGIPYNSNFNYTTFLGAYVPDGIQNIGFQFWGQYDSVRIPEGVTTIGSQAFSGLTGGSIVHLPSTITSVNNSAFGYAESLYVHTETPPTLNSKFTVLSHIYVPANAVETYKTTSPWSDNASIIEAIPE